MSLRKQGANKGAVTAFLISTPESGVDSIAITYALLDPVMTVVRPLAAFFTAAVAGIAENFISGDTDDREIQPDLSCPVDGCCDGIDCDPEVHRRHHGFGEKIFGGIRYAFTGFWDDLAVYFFVGILLAGLITVLAPESFFTAYMGGGIMAMLIMLAAGIPLYVCATASTPIAAALILKGVSPGAALVFLLVGPATNMAALTVLIGIMGKRSTAVYLAAIAVCAVIFGLAVDEIYVFFGLSAQAAAGYARETIPHWMGAAGAVILVAISLPAFWRVTKKKMEKPAESPAASEADREAMEVPGEISKEIPAPSSCGPT